ncbi:MAG: ABC transporter ATP-binding protein [Vulcanimicrobiota bacterium]
MRRYLATLLEPGSARGLFGLLVLTVFTSVLELVSLGAVLPFMGLVVQPDLLSKFPTLEDFLARHQLSHHELLVAVGSGMVVAVILTNIMAVVMANRAQRFTADLHLRLVTRLLQGFLSQPYSWFLNRNTAELARHVEAVEAVTRGVFEPALRLATRVGSMVLVMLMLLLYDPLLLLLMGLVLGGLYAGAYVYCRHRVQALGQQTWAAQREVKLATHRALESAREARLGGFEEFFVGRVLDPVERVQTMGVVRSTLEAVATYLTRTMVILGFLLTTLYLVVRYPAPEHVIPLLGLYALAGYRLMPTLQLAFQSFTLIRSNLTVTRVLAEDLEQSPPQVGGPQLAGLALTEGVALEEVVFGYGEEPWLDVSLRIQAGTRVGLVGPTGAGKSTLVALLCGLLTPTRGRLLHDGEPLEGQRLRRYQKSIGLVPQHIYLLDDTLARNIAFGVADHEIDEQRLWEVLALTQLEEFVRTLPDGLHTSLGERGVRFSGGQRQRVGIARALYPKPQILIFDEATSSLDHRTEGQVTSAMARATRDCTAVVVAHRLATVKDCDLIHVIENGRLTASGTYAELADRSQAFREMAGLA